MANAEEINWGPIARGTSVHALTIADGAATSAVVDFSLHAGGYVDIATSWTAANMGFYVCDTADGTFVILRDEAGNPVQISNILTTGARAYALPSQVFGCKFVKLWSKSSTSATETDTNQTGDATIRLVLKT